MPPRVLGHFPRAAWIGLVGLSLLTAGCTLLRREKAETKSLLNTLTGQPNRSRATNATSALQLEVMREADAFVAAVAQATDDFRMKVPTREIRDAAHQWKLMEATLCYVNATGENPALNAVDMVVLATLSREVIENHWVAEKFGEPALPLLETHRQLETNAWNLVRNVLEPNQQDDLRSLLVQYQQKYSDLRYVAAARLPELAATLGQSTTSSQAQKSGNLFSLLYLNPLAGLDPATQAIEQTRNLAQRAMYYAQRAPILLGWQVEMTTYQLASQPESQAILSDVKDVAQSTKDFAQTAKGLPQLVNDQREAAINQILLGLANERSNIVATLNSQETKLRELLPEVRQTLTAGGAMAQSVDGAVKSLDAFVRSVNPPETNAPAAASSGPPFNVLDYGQAAGQIGGAAQDLNALLSSVNQSLPVVTRLGEQLETDSRAVLNHAFRLALLLILAAGAVATGVVWVSHRLRCRMARLDSAARTSS